MGDGRLRRVLAVAAPVARELPAAADVVGHLGTWVGQLAEREEPQDVGTIEAPETERAAQIVARRGQDLLRGRVLANYAHACAFCGLRSRIPERNSFLLVASHILPWKEASPHARLDPTNGFSLCAIHDRAFEWGFLTVDDDLRVIASTAAAEHYEPEERVRAEILGLHGRELLRAPSHFAPPGRPYLDHHRERVFERRFRGGTVVERD